MPLENDKAKEPQFVKIYDINQTDFWNQIQIPLPDVVLTLPTISYLMLQWRNIKITEEARMFRWLKTVVATEGDLSELFKKNPAMENFSRYVNTRMHHTPTITSTFRDHTLPNDLGEGVKTLHRKNFTRGAFGGFYEAPQDTKGWVRGYGCYTGTTKINDLAREFLGIIAKNNRVDTQYLRFFQSQFPAWEPRRTHPFILTAGILGVKNFTHALERANEHNLTTVLKATLTEASVDALSHYTLASGIKPTYTTAMGKVIRIGKVGGGIAGILISSGLADTIVNMPNGESSLGSLWETVTSLNLSDLAHATAWLNPYSALAEGIYQCGHLDSQGLREFSSQLMSEHDISIENAESAALLNSAAAMADFSRKYIQPLVDDAMQYVDALPQLAGRMLSNLGDVIFPPAHSTSRSESENRKDAQQHELTPKIKTLFGEIDKTREQVTAGKAIHKKTTARQITQVAAMGSDIAIIMQALGIRSAEEVAKASQGLSKISTALDKLDALSKIDGGIFDRLQSGLSIVAGISMITSLFAPKRKDPHTAMVESIMQAIMTLGETLQRVLTNQNLILNATQLTQAVLLRLESFVQYSNTQTQTKLDAMTVKPLQDACRLMRDYLNDQGTEATDDEVRKALRELQHWLQDYLHGENINRAVLTCDTPHIALQNLTQYRHSPMTAIGLVVAQLQLHIGDRIPAEFSRLPAFDLYATVAQLFFEGAAKARFSSPDCYASICTHIEKTAQQFSAFITFLKNNEEAWRILFSQYEHKRDLVGRALSTTTIPNSPQTLGKSIPHATQGETLLNSLDALEEVRLLLEILASWVEGEHSGLLTKKVHALPTKADLLNQNCSDIHAQRRQFVQGKNEKDATKIGRAIRAGADPNTRFSNFQSEGPHDRSWYLANAITFAMFAEWNYQPGRDQSAVDMLYRATSTGIKLQASVQAWKPTSNYDTWPRALSPRQLCLNCTQWSVPLLLTAMGNHDWNDAYVNLGWWTYGGNIFAAECLMIVASLHDPTGLLHRNKLIKAFEYYQAMHHGEVQQVNRMLQEGVDPYCLLWLVCILGRWEIFGHLPLPNDFDYAHTVGTFNFSIHNKGSSWHIYPTTIQQGPAYAYPHNTSCFTPLMAAAHHGRHDVVEALSQLHERGIEVGISQTLATGNHSAANMALKNQYLNIARRLYNLGSPLSGEQLLELNEKCPTQNPLVLPDDVTIALSRARSPEQQTRLETAFLDLATLAQNYSTHFSSMECKPSTEQQAAVQLAEAQREKADLQSRLDRMEAMMQQMLFATQQSTTSPAAEAKIKML